MRKTPRGSGGSARPQLQKKGSNDDQLEVSAPCPVDPHLQALGEDEPGITPETEFRNVQNDPENLLEFLHGLSPNCCGYSGLGKGLKQKLCPAGAHRAA